ncbi:signal peptide peptidase-like 2B-like protein [Corchorus olitorius]|uniref:Signal peptide peptidase-like 2B-like protein n=1 Tax=Corchorus olitorius TaxID=93759 RepID=A0A1R3J510_9ROSI|nr:signal peptide peptidase-like 2B-like protein [Corchorus olitorius]
MQKVLTEVNFAETDSCVGDLKYNWVCLVVLFKKWFKRKGRERKWRANGEFPGASSASNGEIESLEIPATEVGNV